jgi:hypothetical protein
VADFDPDLIRRQIHALETKNLFLVQGIESLGRVLSSQPPVPLLKPYSFKVQGEAGETEEIDANNLTVEQMGCIKAVAPALLRVRDRLSELLANVNVAADSCLHILAYVAPSRGHSSKKGKAGGYPDVLGACCYQGGCAHKVTQDCCTNTYKSSVWQAGATCLICYGSNPKKLKSPRRGK